MVVVKIDIRTLINVDDTQREGNTKTADRRSVTKEIFIRTDSLSFLNKI